MKAPEKKLPVEDFNSPTLTRPTSRIRYNFMQRAEMIFYDTVDWNDSAAKMHETRLRSVTRFNEMNRVKMKNA